MQKQLEKASIGITFSFGSDAETGIFANDRENEKRGEARLLKDLGFARDLDANHICGILEPASQRYTVP